MENYIIKSRLIYEIEILGVKHPKFSKDCVKLAELVASLDDMHYAYRLYKGACMDMQAPLWRKEHFGL